MRCRSMCSRMAKRSGTSKVSIGLGKSLRMFSMRFSESVICKAVVAESIAAGPQTQTARSLAIAMFS